MKCAIILGCKQHSDDINEELRMRCDNVLGIDNISLFIASGGLTQGNKPESRYIRDYLVFKGVPEEKIIEESESLNTIQNALFTREILNLRNIDCDEIIVSTSCYHSRRAEIIFKNIFKREVQVVCSDFKRDNEEFLKLIRDLVFLYNNVNNKQ